jgi:hypothetical protein
VRFYSSTYFMFVNCKHKKVPHHHLWFHVTIFGQQTNPQTNPLSRTSSFSRCHHLSPWQKKARGVSSSLLLSLSTCLISSTTSSPLVIQIGRRSDKSIWLLIPRWSGHWNRSSVSFKNLFTKKFLLVTPTVLFMLARPSKFQEKLLLRPMGEQVV